MYEKRNRALYGNRKEKIILFKLSKSMVLAALGCERGKAGRNSQDV